jgi:hypothetical protein
MTVETQMDRTSLTARLYHINYILDKFQNSELKGMNMLKGHIQKRILLAKHKGTEILGDQ